jgi:hypothetical protein
MIAFVICSVISVLATYALLLSVFTHSFGRYVRAEDKRRYDLGEKRYKEGLVVGKKMPKDA